MKYPQKPTISWIFLIFFEAISFAFSYPSLSISSKKTLSSNNSLIFNEINPISIKIRDLLDDKAFLEKILKDGYEKANEIASKKVKKIHEIVGFWRYSHKAVPFF